MFISRETVYNIWLEQCSLGGNLGFCNCEQPPGSDGTLPVFTDHRHDRWGILTAGRSSSPTRST